MGRSNDIAFMRQVCRSGVDIIVSMPMASETLKRLVPSFSLSMIEVDARCAPRRHYSEFFDEFSHQLFGTAGHQIAAATDDPAAFGQLLLRNTKAFGTLIDNPPDYLSGATYNMLFQRNGIHHCLDVALRDANGPRAILGIFRERDAHAFNQQDLAVIDALYPHLVHASAAEPMPEDFDEIESALLIVDPNGTIQWASPLAREWLGDAAYVTERAALLDRRALPEACRELCRVWQSGRMTRRSHGGRSPVPTVCLPLPGGQLRLRAYELAGLSGQQGQIGIQLHLEMSRSLRILRVLESCALSPQQRRIAFGLARGRSTSDLRKDLGISAETLKSYQKDLYARLGVSGAGALVDLLHERAQTVSLNLTRHWPVASPGDPTTLTDEPVTLRRDDPPARG
ncbi:MAG TPA: hypothetical protein VGE51_03980 [Fontimonas sp.]